MKYPGAKWNPAPANCYTATVTTKLAVCNHRMVGWSSYMRTFQHLREGRRISAHFTIDLQGGIEQHVDTDHVAYTQGISRDQYAYAAKNWRLFQQHNPNVDCIGIEHEDGGKPFDANRPMPDAQFRATVRLHKWLFDKVIEGSPALGVTLISHDMLTTRRHQDPGDWLMTHLAEALTGNNSGLIRKPIQSVRVVPDEQLSEVRKELAATQTILGELEKRVAALEGWRNWGGS